MTDWKAYLRRALPPLADDGGREAEIVEELAQHLADVEGRARRAGATEEEAFAAAVAEIDDRGGFTREVRAALRPDRPALDPLPVTADARGAFRGLALDVRYAFRLLARTPGFALVAILTIALGIGANTAIFTVIDAILLRPLPYPQPDRLVALFQQSRGGDPDTMSPPNFLDLRAQSRALADAAAWDAMGFTITGRGDPVRVPAAEVSASFFDVLRVRPLLGRAFRAEENQPGRTAVAVLSHQLWQARFGSDPTVVGRAVIIDGTPHTIVGVMPEGFVFPDKAQAWRPLEYDVSFTTTNRGGWYLGAVGRLRDGASIESANAEAGTIAPRLEKQYPRTNTGVGFFIQPLHDTIVARSRTPLLVLFAAVGLVLLIGCANVANLLLARASAREAEFAIRAALGAGRGRLARQMLTESAVLAACGAGLGLLVGVGGTRLLVSLAPAGLMRLDAVTFSPIVLPFTLGLMVLTAAIFGGLPALQLGGRQLARPMTSASRAVAGGRGGRLRSSLVVAEIALAMILLWGAGLLLTSFVRLRHVDPGFRSDNGTTFRISLPEAAYATPASINDFFDRLTARLRQVPGVRSVGGTVLLPLSGDSFNFSFRVDGRPPDPPGSERSLETRVVTPGYFRTLGIPLVRGRLFTDGDRQETTPVALLNVTAARRYFNGEDPIGRRIELGWRRHGQRVAGEVVGIVADVREYSLRRGVPPEIYLPIGQTPLNSMSVVVRAGVPARSLVASFRAVLHDLDRNLPFPEVTTLEEHVANSIGQARFLATLLVLFAVLAVALASVGVFGVMSYSVAQRTREIGIRLALGCQRGRLLRDIVGRALLLAAIGVILGAAGSLGLGRLLGSLLFETNLADSRILAAVVAVLLSVAAAACLVPALRATRVDAVTALRME